MTNNITIIGAGIAGLTTAIALEQAGIRYTIFEAADHLRAAGAGLALSANAIKAFEKLGIAGDIIQHGRLLSFFTIYDKKGKVITRTDSEAVRQIFGPDNFAIHRAALQKVLLSKIDITRLYTNKKAVDYQEVNDSLLIKFADGSTHHTDALVIADGIHSLIRKKLLPGSTPRYAGYTCWRAVANNTSLQVAESSETWGTGKRFGMVPLAENKLYWFACLNAPENDSVMKAYTNDDLLAHFQDFHPPIPDIIRQTPKEDLIWNDIIDIKPIDHYAFNNIVLLGDAAHATTPNMAQGACQAIEDAVILTDELKNNREPAKAFRSYEKRRLKRTHYITNTSWNIGRIAQTGNGLIAGVRNMVFRNLPERLKDKQLKTLYTVDF